MFEIGDEVRVVGTGEMRKVVGIGPGEFVMTQLGNDASSVRPIQRADLELVARATKSDALPGFVPSRSIME